MLHDFEYRWENKRSNQKELTNETSVTYFVKRNSYGQFQLLASNMMILISNILKMRHDH